MSFISKKVEAFINDEDGIALTEYLVLLGLLVAGVIAAVTTLGGGISAAFNEWATFIDNTLGDPQLPS